MEGWAQHDSLRRRDSIVPALHRVGGARNRPAVASPVGVMGLGAGRVVEALVGVGAEIIALGLEQIGGGTFAAGGVEEGEGGAEGGGGGGFLGGKRDKGSPKAGGGLD